MSDHPIAEQREPKVAVEDAGYKWAYVFITFALFIDVMYRGWARNEAAWDLMILIVVGGAISAVYQARQKRLAVWIAVLLVCLAIAFPALLAAMYQFQFLR